MSTEDFEAFTVINAIWSYNSSIVPEMKPTRRPFHRVRLDPEQRHQLPQLLQRVLVVMAQSFQSVKNDIDPLAVHEICRFRGMCLSELQRVISNATANNTTLALAAVLLSVNTGDPVLQTTRLHADRHQVGAEMQVTCSFAWVSHLEAANKLVALRGGARQCFGDLSYLKHHFLNYLMLDILTISSCPDRRIDPVAIVKQLEYLDLLRSQEREVMSSSSQCPMEVLEMIVHINIFRHCSHLSEQDQRFSNELDFATIRHIIEAFDPYSWAVRVSDFDRTRPQTIDDQATDAELSALTSVATCYQAAAYLYLLLAPAAPIDARVQTALRVAYRTAIRHFRLLFFTASTDYAAPLESQLWKCVTWPLLISTYASIHTESWEESESYNEVYEDLEALEEATSFLGPGPISDAARVMVRLQTRKREIRRDEGNFKFRYMILI